MHGLRLAVRALWWRRALSLTILLIAVVSITVAALGPLYTRASEESLLRDRLRSTPGSASGIEFADPSGVTSPSAGMLLAELANAGLDVPAVYYGHPITGLSTTQSLTIGNPGADAGSYVTRLVWREGQCQHLRFVAGRCPDSPYDVAVSVGTAAELGLRLGSALELEGVGGKDRSSRPVVAGIYRPVDPGERYWFDQGLFDAHSAFQDAPARVDSVFLTQQLMSRVTEGSPRATQQYLLAVDRVRLDDLGRLRRVVVKASADALSVQNLDEVGRRVGIQLTTNLPSILDGVEGDRRVVRSSVPLVIVQLLLLTWFVLFLVVGSATEQRAGEVALAKLRGLGPLSAAGLALGEPLLLLLVAVPIGLMLALVAAHALAGAALLPGTPVQVRPPVLLALAMVLLGGVAAAGLAVRRTLADPVLQQMRRAPRAGARRSVAVDAVVAALAVAGVYQLLGSGQLSPGKGTELALLTPGLLALAVALMGVRLLPWVTRLGIRRTQRSSHVAAFLALRQIGRRPAGLRIVVLLTVSVALATFAVDGWQVAANNRAARAAQEIGASRVVHVEAASAADLLAAVRRADLGGRAAMAVSELVSANGTATTVAVDSERLAAVASWRTTWAAEPLAELAHRIRPATPSPVSLRGDRLTVLTRASFLRLETATSLVAGLQQANRDIEVNLGALRPGEAAYAGPVPFCAAGCRLRSLSLQRGLGGFGTIRGRLLLRGIEMSGRGAAAVDAGLRVPGRWWVPPSRVIDPSRPAPITVYPNRTGLEVDIDAQGSDVPVFAPVDSPYPLPAVLGVDSPIEPLAGEAPGTVSGTGLDGESVLLQPVARIVLPRAGRVGALVDLTYADRIAAPGERRTDDQVWLAPGVSPTLLDRLRADGVRVLSVETIAQRRARLDRAGPALALLLFLVAAVAALLLAFAAVVTTVYISGRRRAYELAAMRTFGAARTVLVRAGAAEQLALLATGVVLGVAAGMVAALLALPAVPVYGGQAVGPPLDFTPAWGTLGVLLAAATVALVGVSYAAARQLVRVSLPDRLREAQA